MANILDYLDWRGDITFEERPFNEVDNLILSVLSYLNFDGIVSGSAKSVSIRTVNRLYQAGVQARRGETEEMTAFSDAFDSHIPELLEKAATSRRFGRTKMCHYVSRTDEDNTKQMAAVTFLLEDGTKYVSFRGTDDSLTGWKEDFDLSYMDATAGQKDAVKYMNCSFRNNRAPLRVGGHSKGGNFAIYAAAFCNSRVREQIVAVYSNDGPGFKTSIAKSPEIRAVREKTVKYSPEYSAIGAILTHTVPVHLVQSNMKGVDQHNAFSWQVKGGHFVETDERDPGSILFDKTMNRWINGESEENRKLFIDTLFGMFEDAGVKTFSEVIGNKVQSMRIIWNALRAMPRDSRNKFLTIFLHLEQNRLKAQAESRTRNSMDTGGEPRKAGGKSGHSERAAVSGGHAGNGDAVRGNKTLSDTLDAIRSMIPKIPVSGAAIRSAVGAAAGSGGSAAPRHVSETGFTAGFAVSAPGEEDDGTETPVSETRMGKVARMKWKLFHMEDDGNTSDEDW